MTEPLPPKFSTHLLDARLAQERARNEADRQQILVLALAWLAANGQRFGIDRGYLFGSVTQAGRFRRDSDVDLAVESLGSGDPFGLMADLGLAIDREVDLVPLDQCDFAEKIRRTGVAWTANELPA